MTGGNIALRPSYWASVSGGKDSLYMLNLILHNLDKYPLDGVFHFELEIDYPFIHEVIDYMESECKRFGIPFLRIKPRKSWGELYERWGYPTRTIRWCNEHYKLDCKKQHDKWLASQGYYTVSYIGFCADEEKRFKRNDWKKGSKNIRWRKTALLKMIFGNGQKQCLYLIIITKSTNGADVCTALCPLISLSPTFTNTIPPISLLCSKKCGKRKQCEKESLVDRSR